MGIILIIVAAFIIAKTSYKSSGQKTDDQVPTSNALSIVADDWVYGNRDAKVTIVEYLDFECEACGAYYPITTKLKEEYKDSMSFVVRYFPLPGHKNSLTAAKAVEAAGEQGKFWEMYSALYENQKEWAEKQVADQSLFEKYATAIGLDMHRWKQDVESEEVKDRIQRNYEEAMKLNLQGTPSFFLNGKKIESPRGYEAFKLLVEEAKNK